MVKLGIGLLPDEHLRQQAIRLSQILGEKYQTSYVLGDPTSSIWSENGPRPHITLFQGDFNHPKIVESIVSDLAKKISEQITLRNKGLSIWSEGFVFYDFQTSGEDYLQPKGLNWLHNKTVDVLKPRIYKNVAPIAASQNLIGLTKQELSSIAKYSYPFARKAFRPHITLARVIGSHTYEGEIVDPSPKATDIFELLRKADYESPGLIPWGGAVTVPAAIILYSIGIDGSCTRIINKWTLSQPKEK